jgi:tetratricopeptide (TPR) repeat protein
MLRAMLLRRRLRALAIAGCIAVAGLPRVALAQDTTAGNVAAARKHFEKARTCYQQGAYREAVAELEAAHQLDPTAKDLVFNLGVVHEKLADIDEALKWFRLYTTMDLAAPERDRADAYIRRIEGAKRELEEKQATSLPPPLPLPPPPAPVVEPTGATPPPPAAVPTPLPSVQPLVTVSSAPAHASVNASANGSVNGMGRSDGLTWTVAGVSTAALAFGIVMAVKAENDKPDANYVTGRNGNINDLQNLVDQAHREAIMADIGFATALVSGIGATYLYFGRSRHVSSGPYGSANVSAGPMFGGGMMLVKGFF